MKHWYLLQTKANQEKRALLNLSQQSYHVYQPLINVRKLRQKKWSDIPEALFPNYLFIHLDDKKDNWSKIQFTLGVSRLVRFGKDATPSIVPNAIIESLKNAERALRQPKETGSQFKHGDSLSLNNQQFKDITVIFEKSKQDRIVVLLNLLGRCHRLTVNENDVKKK